MDDLQDPGLSGPGTAQAPTFSLLNCDPGFPLAKPGGETQANMEMLAFRGLNLKLALAF